MYRNTIEGTSSINKYTKPQLSSHLTSKFLFLHKFLLIFHILVSIRSSLEIIKRNIYRLYKMIMEEVFPPWRWGRLGWRHNFKGRSVHLGLPLVAQVQMGEQC
jgi:hypothetical protein